MSARLAPSQSEVERAFADAMSAAGFTPGPIQPDTDGFVRFDAPGDKKGRQNGFYKLRHGKWPVGWFGDWKANEQHQWFYHDPASGELTDAERRQIKKEQAALRAEAAQAREAKQAEVAENARSMWDRADSNVEGHQYLLRKRIDIARGLRLYTARDGAQLLAVPLYSFDMNGTPRLTNLQTIDGDGSKRFLKAGRVEGCFFSLKGDTSWIVVCEGVATAFSIWAATGLSVVAAFNSGNLIPVVKDLARNRPDSRLMIAGDDDVIAPPDWEDRGKGKPWVNTGRTKAEAAAKAVGCRWIVPVFATGPERGATDFNDLALREGGEMVGAQIMGAIRGVAAPEDIDPGAEIVPIDRVQDEGWRSKIPLTSSGALDGSNVEGVALYIANHRRCWVLILSPEQVTSIRTNTSAGQWLDITKAQLAGGAKNLFEGEMIGIYRDVIFVESTRTYRYFGGAGGNVEIHRALFCGAQAGVTSSGGQTDGWGRMKLVERTFDYGKRYAVAATFIWGLAKTRFQNQSDFGVIAVDTAAKPAV